MRIDIHAHILPETWPPLKDRYGYGGFIQIQHVEPGVAHMVYDDGRFFRAVKENCWNPEAILQDMERHKVDVMVLSTVPVLFNYWAKPEDTLDWSRFLNDHLASVQAQYPTRFVALGTLPMQAPELAVRELERCVQELHLPGVEIGSNIEGVNLDDERFFAVYEAAEDLGACIFVHPWNMMGMDQMRKYWLPWLVGMPAETSRAICSLMFGGVFDRFPKLRFLFAHAGGSFPITLGRIQHGYNCRPDLVNVNDVRPPREYVGHFWVDSITHDVAALRYIVELFGTRRIAMGSDYPFPLGDLTHGSIVENATFLSPEQKEEIFAAAALEFLGLPKSRFVAEQTESRTE